jgi:hypothetical protein
MNQNRSIALGVVSVVVLLAGLLVANLHSGGDGNTEKALYPSLKTEADSINAVRIFKAGDARVIELLRKDKDWTITERGGYPADASKVRKLIVALSDAKTVEEKTSNPASYATLGVEDVSDKESTGVRLELAGGKTPINVIVGKANADKVFVRRVGEKPSWLLNTGIDAPQLVDAWLKRELIDVGGDRIQSAQVTVGDKSYTAAKSARAEGDFKIEGLPKGKEPNTGAANSFASALQGLNLSEVRTAQEFGSPPPSGTATLKTFDGLVAQVTGWVQDSKRYVSIATSYDEAQAQKFSLKPAVEATTETPPKDASPKETPKETKAEQTQEATPEQKARDEATAANQRFTGWVFEIPTYKYDAIFKPVDQLVKVVEPVKKK